MEPMEANQVLARLLLLAVVAVAAVALQISKQLVPQEAVLAALWEILGEVLEAVRQHPVQVQLIQQPQTETLETEVWLLIA
jgi:hypothetical protein